jgi:uncharacterized protein with PIN domain
MINDDVKYVDWELLYSVLNNKHVWGTGYLRGHRVILTEEQKQHSYFNFEKWQKKIEPKIIAIKKIRVAQKNTMIVIGEVKMVCPYCKKRAKNLIEEDLSKPRFKFLYMCRNCKINYWEDEHGIPKQPDGLDAWR